MATNKKFLDFYYNKKKYYKQIIENIDSTVSNEQRNYTDVYFDGGYGYKPEESRDWIIKNTSLSNYRGTCLDVGSGDGYWSWILSEWYNVTGIDPLSGPIDLSNEIKKILPDEISNRTNFIVGDALTHIPKEKYDVIFLRAPSFWNYPPKNDLTIDELIEMLDLDLKNIEQVWLGDGYSRKEVDDKLTEYKKYFNATNPKDAELINYAKYANNFEKYLQQMISICNKMIYFELSSRQEFWGKFIGSTYNHDPKEIEKLFSKYGKCNVKHTSGYLIAELYLN
tara:strand:- start:35 stop:877 length:843 start_codon:yes stop_codon:yes gene_type:complete